MIHRPWLGFYKFAQESAAPEDTAPREGIQQ